ncbi:serine O-acetyltransferase, partial [archaeon]
MKVLNRVSEAKNVVSIVWERLRKEAQAVADKEELMSSLIDDAILSHNTFWEALSFRLVTKLNGTLIKQAHWLKIFHEAYNLSIERDNVDLEHAACVDLAAIEERDPACDSYLTAFMFFKGYKALEIYRVSHVLWIAGRKELALLMQSRSSEVFAVDIHPAARIGSGLMIDHATGLVIGETAVVGNNCSFLHGVTLGGTGKDWGDRHPKLGDNVSVGCNASILGNIRINDDCKIGANSVVIREVPLGATAVGSPARVIGSGAGVEGK